MKNQNETQQTNQQKIKKKHNTEKKDEQIRSDQAPRLTTSEW